MADDPAPQPSQPRRHRPRLSELSRETTEDDLWDLDNDAGVPPEEPSDADEPADTGATTPPVVDEPPDEASPAESETDEAPEPAAEEEAESSTEASEPEPAAEAPEEEPAAVSSEAPTPEVAPAPTKPEAKSPATLPPPNPREKISLAVMAVIFLGLAIWWFVGLFSDVATERLGSDLPDFPIEGNHGEVASASTFWRTPIREGDGRDVARADVSHLPVITLRLNGGSGALRAIFRTDRGEFVGDSITRTFENGRFVDNGSHTMDFPATDGFETDGEYNGYRVGSERWTVEILEGPAANAAGSSFRSLFTTPISPERR